MTDINLGIYTAQLEVRNCIYATSEHLQISYHHYPTDSLGRFSGRLIAADPKPGYRPIPSSLMVKQPTNFQIEPDRALEVSRMISRVNTQIDAQNNRDCRYW